MIHKTEPQDVEIAEVTRENLGEIVGFLTGEKNIKAYMDPKTDHFSIKLQSGTQKVYIGDYAVKFLKTGEKAIITKEAYEANFKNT